MFPQIEYKKKEEMIVSFSGTALEYLQSIYRDPTQEQFIRMRAARDAIAYESPKLAVMATVDGKSFAELLDRRIAHMRKVQAGLIATPKERPTVEITRPLPPAYDRRYRRV
jgi:hypothetical protein